MTARQAKLHIAMQLLLRRSNATPTISWAVCRASKRGRDEALGHLETALELARASNNVAPSDSDVTVRHCETELAKVRYALGDALTERNDWSGASEHFAAAAELRPQWDTARAPWRELPSARSIWRGERGVRAGFDTRSDRCCGGVQ